MRTCYIIAAGEMEKNFPTPEVDDYVIAADAGYLKLQKLGIEPDLIIGDFDSLEEIPFGANVMRFPAEKDDTDTMLAIKAGLNMNYRNFRIYGGLGGKRLDHTIANIQSLCFLASHSATGVLVGDNENIIVIKDSTIRFSEDMKGYISIFASGGVCKGVTISGLKYELNNDILNSSFPIGTSNKFIGKKSTIKVRDGMLTIMWTGEA